MLNALVGLGATIHSVELDSEVNRSQRFDLVLDARR
jgi:hypothetical protein